MAFVASSFVNTCRTGAVSSHTRLSQCVRRASTAFVQYFPGQYELTELRKLAEEYAEVAVSAASNVTLKVPHRSDRNCSYGHAYLKCGSLPNMHDALKKVRPISTLPSGRPAMVPAVVKLANTKSQNSLYLAPSPEDPFVVKYHDINKKLREVFGQQGTVQKVTVLESNGWPHGIAFVEFAEDDGAMKAATAINGRKPHGFDFELEVKVKLPSSA
eukprot:comp17260_c0_seq1/m.16334 comp17260_c0_seq1/g.16334  ORF comp17260_c0_seq1/g.16334 comp17260_c0_seq1/m.16334 type:complete len:215 (-) comp17260_c0_seq1:497-1141(-)